MLDGPNDPRHGVQGRCTVNARDSLQRRPKTIGILSKFIENN